jgi:uncharacterized protein GlcG (DUF336 family)
MDDSLRSSTISRQRRTGSIEPLENRDLLAANILIDSCGIKISADNANDAIALTVDGADIVVSADGIEIGRVASSEVSFISIDSGGGNDFIDVSSDISARLSVNAGDGNDTVFAGGGMAKITGGAGDDVIRGSDQADNIDGGAGNDLIMGMGGADLIDGALGDDTIEGGLGDDFILGGAGDDFIEGDEGNDRMYGGAGNDSIDGGNSVLLVGTGNDRLIGGPGEDQLEGRDGYDVIVQDGGPAPFLGSSAAPPANFETADSVETLSADNVDLLLRRAAAATASQDAIIAIVDRNGRILNVRVESGVSPVLLADQANLLTFAIDGAVAKARTAAFFANNGAPLTSRSIQFISQTTMLERAVNSNPNIGQGDPNSTIYGPGFVAPIGIGGHFPPVRNTPTANLFAIEHTNRDTMASPGANRIRENGGGDDVNFQERFNLLTTDLVAGKDLFAPVSFGDVSVSGWNPSAQPRGIATLPGGIPIYKNNQLVGGIGVFFPGTTGFASEENSALSADYDPSRPDRSLEAEYIAFAAVGGSPAGRASLQGPIGDAEAAPDFGLLFGRIDVDGIKVPLFGPDTSSEGLGRFIAFGQSLGLGDANDGTNLLVSGTGRIVDNGWIVGPKSSALGGLSAADVERIINQGVDQALKTRAAIRLRQTGANQLRPGQHTAMVLSVADPDGPILGLYRMPDATIFSIDVSVAKARNTAYYADATALQTPDRIDQNRDGSPDLPTGIAFTNRTFRYAALPFFPSGVDGAPAGPFSILRDGQADPRTGLNNGAPLPTSAFQSVMGYDAFNPGTNFRDPEAVANGNANGIVFFPGSTALFKDLNGDGILELVGGFGVSGDGVDQDDVVTSAGATGFAAPRDIRADRFFVDQIRLPYIKFSRNAERRET